MISLSAASLPQDSSLARRLWLEGLDRRAEMDEDSALVLFRAARDSDPMFLPAQFEYVNQMLGWGERRRLKAEYEALASGGDPFFACFTLIIEHHGNEDQLSVALARLDSAHPSTGCSAVSRLGLLRRSPPGGDNPLELEDYWRRALRLEPQAPEAWAPRAEALLLRGRWDEARAVSRTAIRRGWHPIQQVYYYTLLAAAERGAGDSARSEEIRRAVEAAVRRDGRPGLEWTYLAPLASFLSGPSALRLRDSVVFRRLRLALRYGRWNHRLNALYAVANHLLDQRGEPAAALPYLDHLVALADSVARPLARLQARLQAYRMRGRIYSKMGRLAEAERDLRRAIAVGDSADHPWALGEAYHNLAHVYESAGRLGEASRAADQWIAIVGEMRSSDARMMAYHDAGMIRWKVGWHAAATEAFIKMVSAIEELGSEYYWAGEYFERVGDFARALSYYRLGVQDQRAGTATQGLAGLARMYQALGFPDSAEAAARQHDHLLNSILAVPLLPRLLVRQGRGEEATAVARTWAERRANQGNVQGGALALLELSELLLQLRQSQESALQAEQAAQLARQLNLTDELIRARRLVGAAQVQLGDTTAGLGALREAAALARAHPTTDGIRETHLALGDALAATNRVAEARDAYDRAARAVEQVVGHLVEDLDRARYRARQLAPFDGALRLLLRQPDSPERSASLVRWSQRRKAAALALAVASGAGNGGIFQPVSAEVLKRRLDKDEVLIDYLLLDGVATALVATPAAVHVVPLGASEDSLRQWIGELVRPFSLRYGGRVDVSRLDFDAGLARRLYAALIAPFEPLIARKTRLIIVPDGVLHYLPFEALMSPLGASDLANGADHRGDGMEPGKYLMDRYQVVYRPSSHFPASQANADRNGLTSDDRVLVLAYAAPGEGLEADAIQRAWGSDRVSVLTGPKATETAATQGASYAVLHFAVHAEADDQDPLKSHLRLATDDRNDGYLHLSEIAATRTAAKLVVLSACETLTGKLYDGEGQMGLARAFLASGSKAVVATRWPIGTTAADLMARFYDRLAAGSEPAAALWEAKRALRRDPATAHPFFWAGFVLMSS